MVIVVVAVGVVSDGFAVVWLLGIALSLLVTSCESCVVSVVSLGCFCICSIFFCCECFNVCFCCTFSFETCVEVSSVCGEITWSTDLRCSTIEGPGKGRKNIGEKSVYH